jgi:hypothetical protein
LGAIKIDNGSRALVSEQALNKRTYKFCCYLVEKTSLPQELYPSTPARASGLHWYRKGGGCFFSGCLEPEGPTAESHGDRRLVALGNPNPGMKSLVLTLPLIYSAR